MPNDKKRLDWLKKYPQGVYYAEGLAWIGWAHYKTTFLDNPFSGPREAIDAAIEAERSKS